MPPARAIRCLALFAILVGAPRLAAADDPPFTIGARPAWLLLGGITTGGTVALADRGALVGGHPAAVGAARGGRPDRHQVWLRPGAVRRVHRPRRRSAEALVRDRRG